MTSIKIGFGTWVENSQLIDSRKVSIKQAIQAGYRLFDTAMNYNTWKELALAIKESGIDRKEFYIVYKTHTIPTYELIHEIALFFDGYIDCFMYHNPIIFGNNKRKFKKSFSNGWSVFEEAKSKGDIKFGGVSNFYYNQLTYALEVTQQLGRLPIECNQIEIHYGTFDKKLFNLCANNNVTIMAHTPLCGLFSKQVLPNVSDSVKNRANDLGISIASYILNVMVSIGITPITSSYNYQHIIDNLVILNIDRQEFFKVFDLDKVHPYPMVGISASSYDMDNNMQ